MSPYDPVGRAGFVSVALAAGPYPLRLGAHHRHVVDQSGAPFLIEGDTPWSLIVGLTREEAEQNLENRRRTGFNSIIVNLIDHKYRGPVNRYGEGPFTAPGDFSTPNEKYFGHALCYIGTDEGWSAEALANGPEKCRVWGQYVGKRYR